MKTSKFNVDLSCDYAQWWRYNVYISVVCYDEQSQIVDYLNYVDKIYDIENGEAERSQPANYPVPRQVGLESIPCDHISLYLYVIANTFPRSLAVRDSPPFPATLTVRCDGKAIIKRNCEVNQLGGFTISGEMISCQSDLP